MARGELRAGFDPELVRDLLSGPPVHRPATDRTRPPDAIVDIVWLLFTSIG